MMSQTVIGYFKKCLGGVKQSKMMAVVLAIKEMRYLVVGLFYNLVRLFSYMCICDIKFFGFTVCFYSSIARKVALPSPKTLHPIPLDVY